MVVAIDVGNSAVKIALITDHHVVSVDRLETSDDATRQRIAAIIAPLVERESDIHRSGVALVSVVPAWTDAIMHAAVAAGAPLLVADHGSIPLETRLPNPERVGADRLLDAYAAARSHEPPVIVVDLGTATTVDAVDADGIFAGGAIVPGVELGLAALAGGTAQLPLVPADAPDRAIGTDTSSAIRSGAVLGHVGAVRELVARIAAELVPAGAPRPWVIVTGGFAAAPWAALFLEEDGPAGGRIADAVDPLLTLRGLARLHDELSAVHA